jgi:hypothetical protein
MHRPSHDELVTCLSLRTDATELSVSVPHSQLRPECLECFCGIDTRSCVAKDACCLRPHLCPVCKFVENTNCKHTSVERYYIICAQDCESIHRPLPLHHTAVRDGERNASESTEWATGCRGVLKPDSAVQERDPLRFRAAFGWMALGRSASWHSVSRSEFRRTSLER